MSTSPEGRMRRTAPFAGPEASAGRGGGTADGALGATTAKLSVTVTSGTGTGVPVGTTGGTATGTPTGIVSFVLPSTAATKTLPSSVARRAFTSRYGESSTTKTLSVGSTR